MLGAALAADVSIIALHLTRPAIQIPDREALGMPSHFEASKGAYIIKGYDEDRQKDGVVLMRGTSVISEVCKILPQLIDNGPNIKIVASLSWGLFELQSEVYRNSVMQAEEWLDCMVITNTSIGNMSHWVQHPIVKEYSLSADWDNNWRTGGSLDEIIDEAHLSPRWVLSAIEKFASERKIRLEKLNKQVPDLD